MESVVRVPSRVVSTEAGAIFPREESTERFERSAPVRAEQVAARNGTPSRLDRVAIAFVALASCAPAATSRGTTTATTATHATTTSSAPPPSDTVESACRNAPLLEAGQTIRASTTHRPDLFHASCAYGAGSPDAVYRVHIDRPTHAAFRVSAGYDAALHLRRVCPDGHTEIACNDDSTDERHSAVEADLGPGDYFVVVDGYESHNEGFYALSYSASAAPAGSSAVVSSSTPPVERRPGEVTVSRVAGERGVSGTVHYSKRTVTPHGLTRATTETEAPHCVIDAVDEHDQVVATVEADDHGAFHLEVQNGARVRIRATTRTTFLGSDIRVVSDPGTESPYEVSTDVIPIEGGEHIAFRADVGGREPAGAFNILTQFVKYLPYVNRGFQRALPPLFAFWRRGNNNALPQGNITAFLMEYHRHDGSYAMQIQGGDPGSEDASDSDQFDDPVILHEFTHFVVHTMAGHFSIGGRHQNHELHFPGQALDEGAASAMGCAVAGDSRYWDSAGLEPSGDLIVDEDTESMTLPDRGIGSQNSAMTLIWDLADGAEGLDDRDHDGIAIGLTGVMRIYASFRDDLAVFPGIHTVLERGVQLGLFTEQQATRLVRFPVNQGFDFPVATRDRWPTDLTFPSEVRGHIDGQTQPAPSGGTNVPTNGFDAIRTYRFHVQRRGLVYIDLTIDGAGTQQSGTDLDMQLFSRNLVPVGRSDTQGPQEHIRMFLSPGMYILMIRDGDSNSGLVAAGTHGNRADYTLRVRQSDQFH
jgi:hypothetical protein